MRLINTETLKLHEVSSIKTTDYAILSHRWEGGEVSYQDFRDGKASRKKQWKKIQSCCAKALEDGWDYVIRPGAGFIISGISLLSLTQWIDTCCIDKTSSAELSESINSMFAWYKNARVCYAYLSDVSSDFHDPETSERLSLYSALKPSQWFRRGWTLQELLAPDWIVFLADDWTEIGTKASLATAITSITGITHLFNFEDASVAQKMSWAADRQTTRLEDQAYCMMGLFEVNMPLLYGEGSKAFIRLQLEILSRSDDETIFVWSSPNAGVIHRPGLLTDTPHNFEGSGRIKRGEFDSSRPPHFMTNKGLQLQLLLQQTTVLAEKVPTYMVSMTGDKYVAPLNCIFEDENSATHFVIIYLIENGGVYSRYGDPDLVTEEWIDKRKADGLLTRTLFHIKQSGHNDAMAEVSLPTSISYTMSLGTRAIYDAGYYISERIIWPEHTTSWNFWTGTLIGAESLAATITSLKHFILLRCESSSGPPFTIILGYLLKRPWIGALTKSEGSLRDLATSFDAQDHWPLSQSDPRTLQDRGWVQIGPSRYFDFTLRKTGKPRSSATEKYWIEIKFREQPQETHTNRSDIRSGQLLGQQNRPTVAASMNGITVARRHSLLERGLFRLSHGVNIRSTKRATESAS